MATSKKPQAVFLLGPTGSGKTGAALHLARLLSAQGRQARVINADSRQIYHDFPIITAQPSPEERVVCPHLLYGYLNTRQKSTAWEWSELARQAVEEAYAEGAVPLVVGGTGMYVKTLTQGMANIPRPNAEISARLVRECTEQGSPALHERLGHVDPQSAAKLHPNDRQRVLRALEVWESTGKPLSWWHTNNEPGPDWNILKIGVGLPLAELTPFLNLRIGQMLDAGAVEEARTALAACPDTTAPGWSGIGCAELGQWLTNKISFERCLELWRHNTRAYAKRQWTWFRADKSIHWLRPEEKQNLEWMISKFL